MSAETESLIDRLGAAALDARAAVRECHEARADLRRAVKEAADLVANMSQVAMAERFKPELEKAVASLVATIDRVKHDVDAKLFARFEKLTNTLLHGNAQGRGPSLVDDTEAIRTTGRRLPR